MTSLYRPGFGGGKHCTQKQAIAAETESSTLQDWNSVYRPFKRYAHCDDGAISEGYSESVGRLFAEDWGNLTQLYEITKRDKQFLVFVIHHIDATVPQKYIIKIKINLQSHCPSYARELCKAIEMAVE